MDAVIEEWLVVVVGGGGGRGRHFEASQHRGRVKLGKSLECDSFVMELYILHTRVTCFLRCHVHSQLPSLMLLTSSYLLLLPVDVPVVIWMNLFVWFLLRN